MDKQTERQEERARGSKREQKVGDTWKRAGWEGGSTRERGSETKSDIQSGREKKQL